jgi:eukaryotic-like serine/threonine-protein kinase
MAFREKMEWTMHMGLLVFILAAAAFLSAITTIRLAIRSRQVQLPNLVGQNLTSAQDEARQHGIELKVADRIYDALPAGTVVRQSPAAGTQVKVSQYAHVVVSLGSVKTSIPPIEGTSLRTARIALLQAKLQLGEVSSPYLDDTDGDTVLVQEPKSGAPAASPRVDVLVPQGPRPSALVMPYFIGSSDTETQRQLNSAGIRNVRSTPVPSPQWPVGTVIEQSPAPGARLAMDGSVEIKVASAAPAPAVSQN